MSKGSSAKCNLLWSSTMFPTSVTSNGQMPKDDVIRVSRRVNTMLTPAMRTISLNVVTAALVTPAKAPIWIVRVDGGTPLRVEPMLAAAAPAAAFMARSTMAKRPKPQTVEMSVFHAWEIGSELGLTRSPWCAVHYHGWWLDLNTALRYHSDAPAVDFFYR